MQMPLFQTHSIAVSPSINTISSSYPYLSNPSQLTSSTLSSSLSSAFSPNSSKAFEEPLDLRIHSKCDKGDSAEQSVAFDLSRNVMHTNEVFDFLMRRLTRDSTLCKSSPEEISDDLPDAALAVRLKKRHSKGGSGGKAPCILYHPEPPNSRFKVREMLMQKDSALVFINDGEAVINPFAVERKIQLEELVRMFCELKPEGGYFCKACSRERQSLREMQQHLLCHSDSKFYLCTRCLKGFNDTFDMKRHTRKHTMVRPYKCSQCPSQFSQRCSLEGHLRKVHLMELSFARHQRREVLRVCERCGFACGNYTELLTHTVSDHPTDHDTIARLRRRLTAVANRNATSTSRLS